MARRTEKEETEFKVPETLTLCVNNCGVTGNPATNNMCQKCFNATTTSSSSSSSSSLPSQPQSSSSSSSSSSSVPTPTASSVLTFTAEKKPRSPPPRSPEQSNNSFTCRKHGSVSSASFTSTTPSIESSRTRREVNRCSGCRRKVGLTGFRCRCGELFCADHRYSDRHDCSYDYKAAGREAIARENPVVKAAKIVRV